MRSAEFLAHRAVEPDNLASASARLSPFLAGMVGGRDVRSLPAAQMSLPYAIAARVVYGTAGLSAYTAERRSDPRLAALIKRISIEVDESVTGSDRASVTLVTRDGERIEEPTKTALGAPENPLSDRDLLAKFDELARYSLDPAQARELAEMTLALDGMRDARSLLPVLRIPIADPLQREAARSTRNIMLFPGGNAGDITRPGCTVTIWAIAKSYGSSVPALDGVSLDIRDGEFVTLLGASGSGKTTTLMIVAGFTPPDAGDVLLDGHSIISLPPERRGIGVVFQNYALFPHMTAVRNVAFPLRMRAVPRARRWRERRPLSSE